MRNYAGLKWGEATFIQVRSKFESVEATSGLLKLVVTLKEEIDLPAFLSTKYIAAIVPKGYEGTKQTKPMVQVRLNCKRKYKVGQKNFILV